MITVLVVERKRVTAELIAASLRESGGPFDVFTATSPQEIRGALATQPVDAVLVGYVPVLRHVVDFIERATGNQRIILTGLGSSPFDWPTIPDAVDEVLIGAETVSGITMAVKELLSELFDREPAQETDHNQPASPL